MRIKVAHLASRSGAAVQTYREVSSETIRNYADSRKFMEIVARTVRKRCANMGAFPLIRGVD